MEVEEIYDMAYETAEDLKVTLRDLEARTGKEFENIISGLEEIISELEDMQEENEEETFAIRKRERDFQNSEYERSVM